MKIISIEDDDLKPNKHYLVYVDGFHAIAYYDEFSNEWLYNSRFYDLTYFTHYMPLPKPK